MSSIQLPSSLTIQSAAADHSTLSELISTAKSPVTIDASTLEEIDTAGMQLLLAMFNQLKSQSIETQWGATSTALNQTADILGMSDALALTAKV